MTSDPASVEPRPRGGATTRPAGHGSASVLVADEIRRFVRSEGLQPGSRLGREEDLAREFGVSRPTLREALRLLSGEHLVRASKGRGGGIFVAATPEQGVGLSVSAAVATMLDADAIGLDELLETRILLQVPVAGLAAVRAGEVELSELREMLQELDAATTGPVDPADFDARLHGLIARSADNRVAAAFGGWIVDVLAPRLAELIEPAVVESVIAEQYRDLIAAIVRRDPVAAERAMREHLLYLGDLVHAVRRADAGRGSA